MANNKSIDGLSTRAAKTSAKAKVSVSNQPKVKTPARTKTSIKKSPFIVKAPKPKGPVKTVSPEDFASAPDTNIWDSLKPDSTEEPDFIEEETEEIKETIEPEKKSVKKPVNTSKDEPEEETTVSFLKPVQAFDFNEEEGLTESEETIEDMKKASKEETEEFDYGEEMSKKAKKAKKPKKKISKKRKIVSITALIIVILLIGGVLWLVFWGNDIIAKITGGGGNILDLFTFTTETYDPLKADSNGRTNILAFGTGGYDMSGEEGGGVHDGAQLTDSIMLISFDQKTGDVAMLSLPRDLKGPATCTSTGKINEVYWCNGGGGDASIEQEEKAANALMRDVGSILDVDIQYFAHLNWGSLAAIVDLLGGITVTLDEDITDYYYTEAVFEAGKPYTINGAQAVGLARARHGTSGGDFSRGASQQKIIIGIKDKILEKNLSLTDILGLINTLGDNLRTNFSVSELKTIAHMPEILDFDVMRQISLYPDYMTTGNINGISYVIPKAGAGSYGAVQKYVANQLSSDPRDYEEPTIAIYNASETVGLAASEKAKLEDKGYSITIVDNAPEGEYPSGISLYATTNEKAGTKRMLEEEYNYEPKSKEELPATIAPNYDFIIILNDTNKQNN